MKKWIVTGSLLMALVTVTERAHSQVRVGVNINIGTQPDWGPAGYDYAEYYYLPGIESYYYVPRGQFVYLSNGRWIFSLSLPARYSGYDLYSGYKVVVNRPHAYYYYNDHRIRYSGYKSNYGRQKCRDGYFHQSKYFNGNKKYKGYKYKGNGHGKKKGHWKNRDRYDD